MSSFLSIESSAWSNEERVPHTDLPWVWFGYIFAFAFLVAEVLHVALDLSEGFKLILILIALSGWIYWLFCVSRFHKILEELSAGRYPIDPPKAVGYHFVPFYNFYWLFKWPRVLANYLNERGRVRIVNGYLLGFMLLLSAILRLFDGALGLACLYTVTLYISSKLRRHIDQVKGTNPAMLPPPPPDSRLFRQQDPQATEPQPQQTPQPNAIVRD
ncbi:MAG: hypothetical protein QOD00_2179 [Blastocatellia bacterium]|jgi:hypothetical protein|nr:hypothetical protein [Blastocatellia bacterium]